MIHIHIYPPFVFFFIIDILWELMSGWLRDQMMTRGEGGIGLYEERDESLLKVKEKLLLFPSSLQAFV